MAIPSRQIGWGTEENLLWQISKQLEYLTGIAYNSNNNNVLLDVEDPYYNNPNIRAKIETFSGAFAGEYVDGVTTPFLVIDLNKTSGGIIDYSMFSFNGNSITGTYWFTDNNSTFETRVRYAQAGEGYDRVSYSQDGRIISFFLDETPDTTNSSVEILYTVKLFTLPMYND
jgi:hypothetical protein